MRRNPNWTAREDSRAFAMRELGISHEDIGTRLGRTGEAVKRRLTWMRLSAERRAEIGRTRTRNRGNQIEVRA